MSGNPIQLAELTGVPAEAPEASASRKCLGSSQPHGVSRGTSRERQQRIVRNRKAQVMRRGDRQLRPASVIVFSEAKDAVMERNAAPVRHSLDDPVIGICAPWVSGKGCPSIPVRTTVKWAHDARRGHLGGVSVRVTALLGLLLDSYGCGSSRKHMVRAKRSSTSDHSSRSTHCRPWSQCIEAHLPHLLSETHSQACASGRCANWTGGGQNA